MHAAKTKDDAELEPGREALLELYRDVRAKSEAICAPLETEDYVIQTMDDVSPPKWHLAHTSWFFETFLLSEYSPPYQRFHPLYDHLFNSYYVTHGQPYPRPQRGLLSRPTVSEIAQYRVRVDEAMRQLIQNVAEKSWPAVKSRVILGLNHEQQHQELLYTDIKHILAHNPLKPAYLKPQNQPPLTSTEIHWLEYAGGISEIGHIGKGFAYDNEGPAHQVLLNNFALASRTVTNGEFIQFIMDDGYQRPDFWFSEGWAMVQKNNLRMPLYWEQRDEEWWHFTLHGMQPVNPAAPVCHLSQFEADAYARWAGKRLPTEFEWEHAARGVSIQGNLAESGNLQPTPARSDVDLQQMFGDVWEWTSSAYSAYPGYRPAAGAIGEYNGKFMSLQLVLRGGSFVTPKKHIRASYRNFFYPKDRWQFSGLRLAEDR